MRSSGWLIPGVLAVLASNASGGTLIDIGLAAIEADTNTAETCAAPTGELCLLTWNQNGTLAPGDDEVDVEKFIREFRVIVRPPASPQTQDVRLDPSDLRVEHGAAHAVNETWIDLNNSLPGEARKLIALESRPMRREPYAWGIWVTLPTAAGGGQSPPAVGVCWDLNGCPLRVDGNTVFRTSEEGVELFPEDVHLRRWDADAFFRDTSATVMGCPSAPPTACDALRQLAPHADAGIATYERLTPTVRVGLQVQRASLQLAPPAAVQAAAPLAATATDGSAGRAPHVGGPTLPGHATGYPEKRPTAAMAGPAGVRAAASTAEAPGGGSVVEFPASGSGAWALAAWGLLLLAVYLYSRVAGHGPLEQQTRRRVYDIVATHPGIRVGTIAVRLGLHYTTARYHAARLEKLGLVRALGERQRRYFVPDALPPYDGPAAEALASPASRAVYSVILTADGAHLSAISRALGMAPSSVRDCLTRLRRAGLVHEERKGRRLALHASAVGEAPDEQTQPPGGA